MSSFFLRLQSAAYAKLEEIKEQTAAGLQHMIDQHKYADIDIYVQPTYLLVPDNGVYLK